MYNLPVLLFSNVGTEQYATIAEAQADAEALQGDQFQIFTLYANGQRPIDIKWQLATDHVANVIANKKADLRSGPWTDLEVETLKKAFAKGLDKRQLADKLKRPYSSIYTKLKALGL